MVSKALFLLKLALVWKVLLKLKNLFCKEDLRRTDGRAEERVSGRAGKHTDRETDGRTNRRTVMGWMERKTERDALKEGSVERRKRTR